MLIIPLKMLAANILAKGVGTKIKERKHKCMHTIHTYTQYTYTHITIEMENLWDLIRIADLFSLARLQDAATEFMAKNIEEIHETTEFEVYVSQSAKSIKNRHAQDSIPVIDDIRGYLSQEFPMNNSNLMTNTMKKQLRKKLTIIDKVLDKLGLKRISLNTQRYITKDEEDELLEGWEKI